MKEKSYLKVVERILPVHEGNSSYIVPKLTKYNTINLNLSVVISLIGSLSIKLGYLDKFLDFVHASLALGRLIHWRGT
jgi:hypothetical protein